MQNELHHQLGDKQNEQSTSFWFSHLDYEYIKYFLYMITISAQIASKKIPAQITSKKNNTCTIRNV